MTRKDYVLIAAALAEALSHAQGTAERHGVQLAAVVLADELVATNPRFDRSRFLAAVSGVET